jgi:RimJ/RimL family protein N-acetyltransferase
VRELRPTYPLQTERLLLRPYTDDDLDVLYAMHSREDVTRYLYWGQLTLDETRQMLERRKQRQAIDDETDGILLAAALRDTGVVVGDFNLQQVSREHAQGEIGFVLHPDHQGRGYGVEGATLMLWLGFDQAGMHRIVGRCDARNAPSARLMERLGMRLEAHLREKEFVKGEWCDELVYAMLATEWQDRRGR